MKRNQNDLIKKNNRLTIVVILLSLTAMLLVSFLVFNSFFKKKLSSGTINSSSTSYSSASISISNTSLQAETSTSVSITTSVNNSTSTSENTYPYAVTFPRGEVLTGNYETLGFAMTTYADTDEVVIAYKNIESNPKYKSSSIMSPFIPKTIDTKAITLKESDSVVKEVYVNTELVQTGTPSIIFFDAFNGENTKVYAYTMNDGGIALAFSPGPKQDHYQVIKLRPKE